MVDFDAGSLRIARTFPDSIGYGGYGNDLHNCEGEQTLDWTKLTNPCETLVVYMGITQAPSIAAELIANGRRGDTPVAIIEKATTPQQKVHVGTLATLGEVIANSSVKPPALLIIGDVVKLHDKLKWRP